MKQFSKRLSQIAPANRLTKKEVIVDFNRALSEIKNGRIYVGRYTLKRKVKVIYHYFKASRKSYDENITYNIIISFLSFLRLFKPDAKKEFLVKQAKAILPLEQYSTLKKAFAIKEVIREDKHISKQESLRLKEQAIDFIKFLLKQLDKTNTESF